MVRIHYRPPAFYHASYPRSRRNPHRCIPLAYRAIVVLTLLIAGISMLIAGASPLRAADPLPLSCPNGQTVLLQGRAPPAEALLIVLGGRPVGGGAADRGGVYSLPLRAHERPGAYPVEVQLRSTRAVVGRFTCFVDTPVDSTPTASPTAPAPERTVTPTAPLTRPVATATLPPAGATTSVVVVPTATSAPSGSATPAPTTTAGASPTVSPTTSTVTPTPRPNDVQIDEIVLRDATAPSQRREYVEIRNASAQPINISGWQLRNVTRGGVIPPFVFPDYVIEPAQSIGVFSAVGTNDLVAGDFFWNRTEIWRVGDRAELRDSNDRLISFLVVIEE